MNDVSKLKCTVFSSLPLLPTHRLRSSNRRILPITAVYLLTLLICRLETISSQHKGFPWNDEFLLVMAVVSKRYGTHSHFSTFIMNFDCTIFHCRCLTVTQGYKSGSESLVLLISSQRQIHQVKTCSQEAILVAVIHRSWKRIEWKLRDNLCLNRVDQLNVLAQSAQFSFNSLLSVN